MLRKNISIFIAFCALGFTSISKANDMEIFLKSCAYGTAAGALIGLASLAISEDPSENRNNIARGASLGLYAGIGFGLYTLNAAAVNSRSFESAGRFVQPKKPLQNQMWFSALHRNRQIEGVQLNWASFSF